MINGIVVLSSLQCVLLNKLKALGPLVTPVRCFILSSPNLWKYVVKQLVNIAFLCFGHFKAVSFYGPLHTLFDDLQEITGHLLAIGIALSQQTVLFIFLPCEHCRLVSLQTKETRHILPCDYTKEHVS